MRSGKAAALALVLGLASPTAEVYAAEAPAAPSSQERIVEARLLAPCCYLQTLDIHESPMATELRLEVHDRLAKGESPEVIEDDFVARYGERVRALPRGQDPRRSLLVGSVVALAAAAVGLGALVRRWRRVPAPRPEPSGRDALDDRIDAELQDLEDLEA